MTRRLTSVTAALFLAAAVSAPALGQSLGGAPAGGAANGGNQAAGSTGPVPPRVDSVSERSPIFRYAVLFLLCGAAIGVVIIPGKRSHQD